MSLLPTPRQFAVDANGAPLAGAKLYFYETGTSTPKAVYSDAGLSTALAQPVTADGAGLWPAIYLSSADYKVTLQDAFGVVVWTQDPVTALLGVTGDGSAVKVKGRTLDARAEDVVTVRDFGAGTDTAAFQAAINALPAAGGSILVPPGDYSGVVPGSLSLGGRSVVWSARGATLPSGMPGTVKAVDGGAELTVGQAAHRHNGTATDGHSVLVTRTASYTGGTPGYVNAAHRTQVTVGGGAAAYEWGVLSVMDNSAPAGETVAVYAQSLKRSTGPTWSFCGELRDSSNSSTPAVGIEQAINTQGPDTNGVRVVADLIAAKYDDAGADAEVTYGCRVNASWSGGGAGENAYYRVPFAASCHWTDTAFLASKKGALGTTAGDSITYFTGAAPLAGNTGFIKLMDVRTANGSGHTTTVGRLSRLVDGVDLAHIDLSSTGIALRPNNGAASVEKAGDVSLTVANTGAGQSVALAVSGGAARVKAVGGPLIAEIDGTEWLRLAGDGSLVHRANATTIVDANSHLGLRSYTQATKPSPGTANRLIAISDGAGGLRLAISDGTYWRWPDGSIIV